MKFETFLKKLNTATKPLLAVLIDPDKYNPEVITQCNSANVSCFLVGGSKLHSGSIKQTVVDIKKHTKLPIILFPGDEKQLCAQADGLFLPSLISGRNPEYLIGKQIKMAPQIKKFKLPHLPMAYVLIEGKAISSTQKVTQTQPMMTSNLREILDTVLAAEQLGFKAIYLEAGSGAMVGVPTTIIRKVKQEVAIPLIIGGGINSAAKARAAIKAGANMIVVGNAFEKNVYLVAEIGEVFN